MRLGIILPPWKNIAEGSGGGYAQSGRNAQAEVRALRAETVSLISGERNRKKNAGLAKWHNWTIGGVTSDGRDATNELTYLLLEAALETRLPHHTLTLRVHQDTPEKLMIKALEVVRTGIGMPAFVGDKSYTAFFMRYGIPLEEAREYVITGCLDANLPGKISHSGHRYVCRATGLRYFPS